jgi:hypothetical protein
MYQEASGFGVGLDRDEKKTQPSDGIYLCIGNPGCFTSSLGLGFAGREQAGGSRGRAAG